MNECKFDGKINGTLAFGFSELKEDHHMIPNDGSRDATRVSTSTSTLTVPDVPRARRLLLGLFRVTWTSHRCISPSKGYLHVYPKRINPLPRLTNLRLSTRSLHLPLCRVPR